MVRSPHIAAEHHLALYSGTNIAVVTVLSHIIVTEGLFDEVFIRECRDWSKFQDCAEFVSDPRRNLEEIERLSDHAVGDHQRCRQPLSHRLQRRDLLRLRLRLH